MLTLVLSLLLAAPSVPAGGVVHMSHGRSRAHACPVAGGLLLTAGHVAALGSFMWSDQAGNEGMAHALSTDDVRELGVMQIEWGTPGHVFPLAALPPAEGEKVTILGYDDDHPTKPRSVTAKVLGMDAGFLYYDRSPGYGSSGSCVLNEALEVVAINAMMAVDQNGRVLYGRGPRVDGVWKPRLPQEE